MENMDLVYKSNFTIVQLKKSWESIIMNVDEWLFFACFRSGNSSFAFHSVDLLRTCDINCFLKDPDTSLFMLVAQEEVEV